MTTYDLIEEAHAQAGLNLLEANDALSGRVFDGKVPDGTDPPYVQVYRNVAWPRAAVGESLAGLMVTVTTTFTCHCVGESSAAAEAVGMQVRGSLLNQRPVVAGRSCGLIRQDEALPPSRDENTGRLVMDAVRIYSFISVPA